MNRFVRAALAVALAASLADAQAWRTKWNWFGISAARLGELDGRPNIVVAAPTKQTVYQFSGLAAEPRREIVGGSWVGMQMCSLGDIDGDGVEDFAASADDGRVRVIDGRLGELRYVVPQRTAIGEILPLGVITEPIDSVADLDGDGARELVTGLWSKSAGGIAIFSGRDGCLLRVERTPDRFFRGIVGDADGDGRDDFLFATNDSPDDRPIDVTYSLRSSTDLGKLWSYVISIPSLRPHFTSAKLGDLDGDGVADIAIGVCDDDIAIDSNDRPVHSPPISGRVIVLSGRTGKEIRVLTDGWKWDLFGWSLADAGDVDFDGCSDLLIGSHGDDWGGSSAGYVMLYSGRTGELLRRWRGSTAIAAFVGNAGDVNCDGFPDHFVGAVYDDVGASYEDGALFVLSGFDGSVLQHWGEPQFSIAREKQ